MIYCVHYKVCFIWIHTGQVKERDFILSLKRVLSHLHLLTKHTFMTWHMVFKGSQTVIGPCVPANVSSRQISSCRA